MGKKVLVIEIDHQGNLTKSFNIDASNHPILIDLLDDSLIKIEDSIVNVLPGLDILPSRYDNSVLDNFIMLKQVPLQKVLKSKIDPLRSKYDFEYSKFERRTISSKTQSDNSGDPFAW